MRQLWVAVILGACQASVDLDFGETNVATAEKTRAIYSVTPSGGTAMGGTRISIDGEGFATDFWNGGNTVHIGGVPCDVVEGACTVDCGGSTRIVRDHIPVVCSRMARVLARKRERERGVQRSCLQRSMDLARASGICTTGLDATRRDDNDDRAAARLSYRYATLASGRQTRTAAGRRSR